MKIPDQVFSHEEAKLTEITEKNQNMRYIRQKLVKPEIMTSKTKNKSKAFFRG